ncbi:MAG: DUF721 domain-containing protein [Rickettsiales bacterium]|nr:DUF721 domain-containing protein [Rickettsiales bacterium]
MSKEMPAKKEKRRYGASRLLGDLVMKTTQPIHRKRGFSQQRILSDWHMIVGDMFAQQSTPTKITYDRHGRYGATLHIMINPAWALEMQYVEQDILERIATFFGYRAVEKLHLIQAPIEKENLSTTVKPSQTTQEHEKADENDLDSALKQLEKTLKASSST